MFSFPFCQLLLWLLLVAILGPRHGSLVLNQLLFHRYSARDACPFTPPSSHSLEKKAHANKKMGNNEDSFGLLLYQANSTQQMNEIVEPFHFLKKECDFLNGVGDVTQLRGVLLA